MGDLLPPVGSGLDGVVGNKAFIPLSPPHMGDEEMNFVHEAFNTNWLAPAGPNVDKFEKEMAEYLGVGGAAALSSGTAALHLALEIIGVGQNDIVVCSSSTFIASAQPILYQKGKPVFIDSEPETWNMSPVALERALTQLRKERKVSFQKVDRKQILTDHRQDIWELTCFKMVRETKSTSGISERGESIEAFLLSTDSSSQALLYGRIVFSSPEVFKPCGSVSTIGGQTWRFVAGLGEGTGTGRSAGSGVGAVSSTLSVPLSLSVEVKAAIVVNTYGLSSNFTKIREICDRFSVPIVEDAAESLGGEYLGRKSGTYGDMSILSFNGNKIITTTGGGMLVSNNLEWIKRAKFLSTQAKDPAPYYCHSTLGYNYRLSNVLAGIGRGQLRVLPKRVERRREVFRKYQEGLSCIEDLEWMPEPFGSLHTRWLTICLLPRNKNPSEVMKELSKENIESRRAFNPMHRQKLFREAPFFSHYDSNDENQLSFADRIFNRGICLPSGTAMTDDDVARIIGSLKKILS